MKDNIIQKKSYDFALRILKHYRHLEEKEKHFPLHKQIVRSGTSIAANIEEAIGGYSRKDFKYKLSISYKEARETHMWLRLFKDSEMIDEKLAHSLIEDCTEIIKILTAILNKT
jgi:four helix bundle protein